MRVHLDADENGFHVAAARFNNADDVAVFLQQVCHGAKVLWPQSMGTVRVLGKTAKPKPVVKP